MRFATAMRADDVAGLNATGAVPGGVGDADAADGTGATAGMRWLGGGSGRAGAAPSLPELGGGALGGVGGGSLRGSGGVPIRVGSISGGTWAVGATPDGGSVTPNVSFRPDGAGGRSVSLGAEPDGSGGSTLSRAREGGVKGMREAPLG